MKFYNYFLSAIVSFALLGCSNEKETVVVTDTNPAAKRVHTQEQLKKTGETQPGAALEKVDPAVQINQHP